MAEALSIRNILVVADGTETGVHAARYAIRIAAFHNARLTAVAVVDTATLKSLLKSSVLVETEMEEFGSELEASARANLDYVDRLANEAGVKTETILRKGAAHSQVIREVKQVQPDLLVMGTFSSSMIRRDLSARERRLIVDEAACPIVLVP
jgi:nucleotide-binding universal stress UspA family protein